jgi:hypothetical protein
MSNPFLRWNYCGISDSEIVRVVGGRGNIELNLILNDGERKAGPGIVCFCEVLSAVEVKHSVYA